MREPVLLALIHIFAILSNVNPEGISAHGRRILHGYFRRYINAELEEEYLKIFETTLKFYEDELSDLDEEEFSKGNSIINFQIINICRQIRKGLFLEERMIVFLQLLEFIYEDARTTRQERIIIDIVAGTFSIPEKEYKNATAFMLGDEFDKVTPDCVMLIEGCDRADSTADKYTGRESWHKLEVDGLKGSIYVLFIESISALIFTYQGKASLFFKGRNIVRGRPYLLESGVSIKGRDMEPVYQSGILREFYRKKYQHRIIFEGHNIDFSFKKSDQGVKPMSFRVDSGNLIGIMGGSGVGKTTLLNLLNGKIIPDNGNLYLNGYNIHTEQEQLKGLIGYIPQDDLLIEELTVYQNLYYNARLCFGDFLDKDIRARVSTVLKNLELDEIADLNVGDPLNKKISGGQRKRLNIGLELIREPAILFVDEPTSGLSSHDSWKVMELLKKQTRNGRLIFSIIHQPSSDIIKLFDRLWIIDRGGYMIYDGDSVDSLVYFKTETSTANAAESECPNCGNVETDEILQLIEVKEVTEDGFDGEKRQVQPVEWYYKYQETIKDIIRPPEKIELPASNFKVPGKVSQLKTFFQRNLLRKFSDKQYLTINLLESPLLAVILAYLSKYSIGENYILADNKNLAVFLFMGIVVALFLGLTVSAEELFKDRKTLERQKFLEISRLSYLTSKIGLLFILSAIQTFSFVIISSLILGIEGMLFRHWLILFSVSAFGNILGLNISDGMKSVVSIYILVPLILVPQLLLGGAMIRFDDLHKGITKQIFVPVVGDLMTTRWAYEAITVDQFKNNRYEKYFFDLDMEASQNSWKASFLIPLLERKTQECRLAIGEEEFSEHSRNNLYKLRKYSESLSGPAGMDYSELSGLLTYQTYDTASARLTLEYLDKLKGYYRNRSIIATRQKDTLLMKMESEFGTDYVVSLKNNNYNIALGSIVLNQNYRDKVYENENMIISKADPVFMMPGSNYGRAHFFAPYKMIGKLRIDTLWFNMIVIWLSSIFLTVTLYFNVLKRIINSLGSRKLSVRTDSLKR
ncbi:MAG TPA: ATP-binding cassette domain-containing protein [Bacteroidales bacterium]|nr:ATP-binding cassette domain-containing protein [Bacteroidales bacterium]